MASSEWLAFPWPDYAKNAHTMPDPGVLSPVQPGVGKIDARVWVCKTDSRHFIFFSVCAFHLLFNVVFLPALCYSTSRMLMTWEYNRQVAFNGNLWPQLPEYTLIPNYDPGTKSFHPCLFLNTKSWKHWSFWFLTSFLTLPLPVKTPWCHFFPNN